MKRFAGAKINDFCACGPAGDTAQLSSATMNIILVYVIATNGGRDQFGARANQDRR